MNWKNLILILLLLLFALPVNAKLVQLDENKSKITYTLTGFGIPFKRKQLTTSGQVDLVGADNELLLLTKFDFNTKFTSKNKLFRKVINFDKYPDFSFSTKLENPIYLKDSEDITINGELTFHGVTKKVSTKLKYKKNKDFISLIGFLNIKMTDFGIIPPRILFLSVDNLIKTKVELFINKKL